MTLALHITDTPHPEHLAGGNSQRTSPAHRLTDGLCQCPTIDPNDALPTGECRRCYRLHPDRVSPRITWDRQRWEHTR